MLGGEGRCAPRRCIDVIAGRMAMSLYRMSRQRPLLHWLALASAVLGVVFTVTPDARSQSPLAVELGEAPRRDEPQQSFGWVAYPTPQAAPSRARVVAL